MKKEKLFIIKKYIRATSASEAIKKEKRQEVDDVWIDEDWKKEDKFDKSNLSRSLGF